MTKQDLIALLFLTPFALVIIYVGVLINEF